MNVVVLNGSPKGKSSVSMQSFKYLENHFKKLSAKIFNVAEKINTICKDTQYFNDIINQVKECDMIIWVYPVYSFSVPSQLIKFIELIYQTDAYKAFEGKAVSQINTSLYNCNTTASDYIIQVCEDLKMNIMPVLSSLSSDLLSPQGRKNLIDYGSDIIYRCENNIFYERKYKLSTLKPLALHLPRTDITSKSVNKKVVLLTDCSQASSNLFKMLDYFLKVFSYNIDIISLADIDVECGCSGCLQCWCIDKCCFNDSLEEIIDQKIIDADCIIYAYNINNHSFTSTAKQLEDRLFYTANKQGSKAKGYIISGDITSEPVLCEYIEKKAASDGSYIAGIVSDCSNNAEITAKALTNLAAAVDYSIKNKPQQNKTSCIVNSQEILKDMLFSLREVNKGKLTCTFDGLNNTVRAIWLEYQLSQKPTRERLFKEADKNLLSKYQDVVEKF